MKKLLKLLNNQKATAKEDFRVRYNEEKTPGVWSIGHNDTISIQVKPGSSNKISHEKAKKAFLKRKPLAQITGIEYC